MILFDLPITVPPGFEIFLPPQPVMPTAADWLTVLWEIVRALFGS